MMLTCGPQLCHVDTCKRPGCSREAGCQGHAWREAAPAYYRKLLETIVADAKRDGLVLTAVRAPRRARAR